MRIQVLAAGLLLSCSLATPLWAKSTSPANFEAVADQHILPAYKRLSEQTEYLAKMVTGYCELSYTGPVVELQRQFHASMDAWQAIQHIRFGPAQFQLRSNRMQMWPDKRNSVSKHLRRLMEKQDKEILKADKFAAASVAVQGFSALERLLFTKQSKEPEAAKYRCALLKAITANLAQMSAGIYREWREGEAPFRQILLTATNGNDFYESDQELASTLLNNLHTQLKLILEQKLQRPLGKSVERAKGKRAESWRSHRASRNIEHNFRGLHKLYRTAFAERLAGHPLGESLDSGFQRGLEQLAQLRQPLSQAVADPGQRAEVEKLVAVVIELKALVADKLPKELGLSLGFNSLDGD
ncbi:MAG: imelysin family protein [Chromatiales bacterium]|nr:imelysin family protein [Chromatiales bacterium]